jgi:TonB family protein
LIWLSVAGAAGTWRGCFARKKQIRKYLKLPAFCGVLSRMNFKNLLLAATFTAGLLSVASVSASVIVDSAVTTDVASYSAPTPLKVVAPSGIARRFQGETIRLSLTIDEAGRPKNISLLSARDSNLERNLLPAIAKWQFAPAMKNGRPVSVDVVLPIELVEKSAS